MESEVASATTEIVGFKPVTAGPASALAEQPVRMAQETGEPASGELESEFKPATTEIVEDGHGSDGTGHDHGSGGIGYDPPLGEAVAGASSMAISDATTGYDPPLNEGAAAAVAMTMTLANGFELGCSAALSA